MIRHRLFPAVGVTAAALAFAGCGGDDNGSTDTAAQESNLSGSISGAGASSQEAAQQAWQAGFQTANPNVTVNYDPVGSGGGREQFISGGTVFGGTDDALSGEELTGAQDRCGGADNLIEVPAYVSPIAVIYNLDGVDNLQLSPATVAGIFLGKITQWDAPEIKADNPDADLPSTRITPVHRSDESGTTENFTDYLSKAAPDVWTEDPSGEWPTSGGEAADGTSGVVSAVTNGQGTIGYADASQAADLGKASIKVGDQYVGPTAEAAGAIFDESEETDDPGKYVTTYELNRTATNAYPVVLVSYEMACTSYDDANTAELVKAYLGYIISSEGQQAAADNAGSAPISDSVRSKIQPAIDAIGSGASS